MKKLVNYTFRLLLSISLLIPTLVEPFSVKAASSSATTIQELRAELEKLKQQKAKNESEKKQTQTEINNKKNEIYNAYQEQNTIAKEIDAAKEKVTESEEKISQSKTDMESLLKYYQLSSSNNEYLEYITGATTTTELIMRITAVEQLTTYYKDKIEELNNLIIEKENLQVELTNKNAELDTKINQTTTLLDSLNDQISEINEINEDIDSQIKNQEALINYYKTVCSSETQKLSTCVSVAASAGWLKPLTYGFITSPFGYRGVVISGKGSFHNGTDIGGNAEGTSVYAAAAGTVAAVTRKSRCGGNIVYIHVNVNGVAYTTQYAHLLSYNVKVGDKVTVDTIIGTVGGGPKTWSWDSCSTGAHLHFAIAKGYYLGGGTNGYSSWSKFIANSTKPPGYPGLRVKWYKRT